VADGTGNPLTTITDANGIYSFEGLAPGDYIVVVDGSNFSAGPLIGKTISGSASDPNNNVDNDNNGELQSGTIFGFPYTIAATRAIRLDYGLEVEAGPTGPALDTNNTLDIGFVQPNQAPILGNLQGNVANFVEGGATVAFDALLDATVSDADSPNFDGGSLSISIANPFAGDSIVINTGGTVTATMNPGNTSGTVSVGGVQIGTWAMESTGLTMVFSFDADATPARVQDLVRAIGYRSTDEVNPDTTTRNVTITLNDGDGTDNGGDPETSVTTTVTVAAVNDHPEGADNSKTILEDSTYTFGLADFSITDAENDDLGSVQIIVAPTAGNLYYDPDGEGAAEATIVGSMQSISAEDIALGKLTYRPAANASGANYAFFTFKVSDDGPTGGLNTPQDPNADTFTFDVTSVNDAPLNDAPFVQNGLEDQPLVFSAGNANAITVSDADVGGGILSVALQVTDGTLTLGADVGDLALAPVGDGSSLVVITGTVSAINAALEGLTYNGPQDANGARTLTITTTDNGFTGPNLIVNPGAEVGPSAANYSTSVVPAGWTLVNGSGGFTALDYDIPGQSADDLDELDSAAIDGGDSYFAGGPSTPEVTTLTQVIDVSNDAARIDSGTMLAYLSGMFGGYLGVSDTMTLSIVFRSATDEALGSLSIGAPMPADRANETTLVPSLGVEAVPVGTRYIEVFLIATDGGDGAYGNGYADNLSLVLSQFDSDAVTINLAAVNDAPTAADNTVTVSEDDPYVFTVDDFGFADAIDGDDLASVIITGLPVKGSILYDGIAIEEGDEFSAEDIANGLLTYQSMPDEYGEDYASFTFQVRDDGGTLNGGVDLSAEQTITIDVTPDNLPPVLDLNGAEAGIDGTGAYSEGDAGDFLHPDLVISDVDDTMLESASVTITGGLIAGQDYLTVNGGTFGEINGLTIGYNGTTGVLTLTGSGTLAAYQDALRQVGFESVSDAPGTSRTLQWTVSDGSASSTVATTTITVSQINDAPVNSVPSAVQTFNEDGSVTFNAANGNLISVADADAGSGNLTVTLSVQSGALSLSTTSNLTVTGDGTNAVTLSGTAANINAALNGLVYNPGANYNGERTITIVTNDQGNTGSDPGLSGNGTSEQDSDTILVDVDAVNDAPVVIGDGTADAAEIAEDTPGSGQTINSLFAGQYSDAADAQFAAGNPAGSSSGSFAGVAVVANGSSGATGQWQYYNSSTSTWVDVGSRSTASALLIGSGTLVRFNPAPEYSGTAPTLTVHLIDNSLGYGISHGQIVDISGVGATGGSTPFSTGTVVLSQNVTEVLDPPVLTVADTSVSGTEDTDLVFSAANGNAIIVSDVDTSIISVTLTVASGTVTLSQTDGIGFHVGDNNNDSTMTIIGTAAAINAALEGLVYRGNLNFQGSDTLSVTVADGNAQDSETIAIALADDGEIDGDTGNNTQTGTPGNDRFDLSQGGDDDTSGGSGRDVFYYGGALTGEDKTDGGDAGGDPRGDLVVIQGNYNLTLGEETLIDIEKFRVLRGTNTDFGYEGGGTFNYNITTVDANVPAGGLLVVQGGSLQVGEHLTFNGSAETNGRFQVFGGRDDDTLVGGAGDDHLLGRAGDDTLTGNGGADRLRGGLGGDAMNGGAGADVFVYAALPSAPDNPYTVAALESASLNYDTITGFNYAEDRIDLPQTVASLAQLLTGSLSEASFDADLAAAVNGALNPNAAVLFTANAGDHSGDTFLIIDADNNGSYQANVDYVIQLASPIGTPPTGTEMFI
jgi:hypothetical protein